MLRSGTNSIQEVAQPPQWRFPASTSLSHSRTCGHMEIQQQQVRLKQGCARKALGDQISALKISECWRESAGITVSFAQRVLIPTCASGQEMLNLYTIRGWGGYMISLACYSSASLPSFHVCCTDRDVTNTNPASFAIIKLCFSVFCLFTLSLIYCSHWHCYHACMFVMLTTLVLPT